MTSGCWSILRTSSARAVFHTITMWSMPTERRMLSAVGCHSTKLTRRVCSRRSTIGWLRWRLCRPSSGMYHNLTVVSSEQEAMTLSSDGLNRISVTAPLWPVTRPACISTRPIYKGDERFIREEQQTDMLSIVYPNSIDCPFKMTASSKCEKQ